MERSGGYEQPPGQGWPTGPAPPYETEQRRDLLPIILGAIAVVLGLAGIVIGVTALTQEGETAQPTPTVTDVVVSGEQLADLSVTSNKLADGSVTSDKLADGSVTTSKLARGGVTAAKVANNSLGGDQIDESTLGKVPAAEEADTAQTAEVATTLEGFDPASIAPRVETVQASSDSTGDDVKAASAACPEGTQVLSGGAAILTAEEQAFPQIALSASTPDGTGWTAQAFEIVPTDVSWSVQVTAVCAALSGG
jgi:hypothetical protein